ncbi:MAG: hypothetical protein KUG64_10765 [Cycloclasticus sp.]|nr:hypothetical protein [Cycloclasticus sp.]
MKELTDVQKDIIRVKAKLMEQAMWDAAEKESYVYKPKFSLFNLIGEYPRVAIVIVMPISMCIAAALVDMMS